MNTQNNLTCLIVASLVLSVAGIAEAVTWYAGPLWVSPGDKIVCAAINVSGKDVKQLAIEATIEDMSSVFLQLAGPGLTQTASETNGNIAPRPGFCMFKFKGGKKSVRATACVRSGPGFGTCDTTIVPN